MKSIDFICGDRYINFDLLPWLVIEYRYREYNAVKKLANINIIIIDFEIDRDDVIMIISLKIFKLGGSDIFVMIMYTFYNKYYLRKKLKKKQIDET